MKRTTFTAVGLVAMTFVACNTATKTETPTVQETAVTETVTRETTTQFEEKAMEDCIAYSKIMNDIKLLEAAELQQKTDSIEAAEISLKEALAKAVAAKKNRPFVVGFAAETDNVEQYAKDKLIAKKLDMIAANKVGDGLGFGVDDNALSVFWQAGSKLLPKAPKSHLARDLMTIIIEQYYAKNTTEST